MSSLNLGQWQQVGAVLINEVKNVLITVLSATAVLHGSITLGVMLSIQYIIGQMQGPISQFVSFMQDTAGRAAQPGTSRRNTWQAR